MTIKGRILARFPARVLGGDGITITKANGTYTFAATSVSALLSGTSVTSVLIGTGSKSFVTQAGKFFAAGTWLNIRSAANPTTNYMIGQSTAYVGTALTVTVPAGSAFGAGTLADWTIEVSSAPGAAGATGATGAAGAAGSQGLAGASPGFIQAYDSSTADADPGAGEFRFNNADPSLATAIYIDNVDAYGGDVTGIVDRWDDPTNTIKGTIQMIKVGTPGTWASLFVSGTVVDGTGYRKLTLSSGQAVGTFTAADQFSMFFARAGDAGSMSGPASSTDNAIARWNGALGTSVQDSAVTIDDTTGKLTGARFGNTGLNVEDTNASHLLNIKPGSDLTADRILTLTTGDAARTLDISAASVTITAAGAALVDDADAAAQRTTLGVPYGKQSIWIPAGAMVSRTTNGAAVGTIEMATNKNMLVTKDFDAATQEFAQFEIQWPKGADEGTITWKPVWSHPSTTTNFGVVFSLAAVGRSDDDAGDVAFGTEQTSTDTGGTTNDVYIGPESAALTISGLAEGDSVQFQVARNVADGSDTLAVDARLHGILILYVNNITNDS